MKHFKLYNFAKWKGCLDIKLAKFEVHLIAGYKADYVRQMFVAMQDKRLKFT